MKNLWILLLLISPSLFAQETHFTFTGKVIDKNTKGPLAGASVFAQNTTFGVATDAQGEFRLKLPLGGYALVITFTGYETESMRISNSVEMNNVTVELKPKEKSMEEVSIVASNEVKDGWKKYGSFFNENFIGKSEFSRQAVITNPEVLKFFFSKKRNRLKVTATEPLVVNNDALGYTVKFAVDSFTYEYNTHTTLFVGYPLFEEKTGSAEQQLVWKKNRAEAYNGSLLHFLRSLFNKTLSQEGFEVQFLVNDNNNEKTITLTNAYGALNYEKDDSTNTVLFSPNQPDVIVIYQKAKPQQAFLDFDPKVKKDFQASVLSVLPGKDIVIEQNGYYYDQSDIIVNGYWGFMKIGDMLPYDYKVE